MRADEVIIAPLVTEKSNVLREKRKYTFKINPRANKIQVKEAIQNLFEVTPIDCAIINQKGKPKRSRTIKYGYTSSWKKAIVTLKEGDSIAIFEGA